MKIACGIILYNPKLDDIKNILFYAEYFEKLYVYDNTETGERQYCNYLLKNNIDILHTGLNDGISIACDKMCKLAQKDKYDYIILFDQDSRMSIESIEKMQKNLSDEKVAIYCPQIVYQNEKEIDEHGVKKVDWCITSGSLIKLKFYKKIWSFDQNYFIDRVDRDCCKQITMKGYFIEQINDAILFQELGNLKIIGKRKYYMHSSIRHYYIFRNRLYYNNKFGINKIVTLGQCFRHIKNIILFENQKIEKLQLVYKGYRDNKKGHYGKINCTKIK